ncbi:hypothetical protein D3C81_2148450 [compost metagenome]
MTEAAYRNQGNRHVGIVGKGHHRQRQHQKCAGYGRSHHRIDSGKAEEAHIQFGDITAGNAAQIGGEERQPGEECNLFQIHAVGFSEI